MLLYGAFSGYTAELVLPQLVNRGIAVLLSGRTKWKVESVAERLGLPSVVFSLTDPAAVDQAIRGCSLILNVAGPFVHTAPPLIDACLRERVDYLDLSGELELLEYARQAGRFAQSLGVMLLPAVGFDVVPSDCLAVHVAQQLPEAQQLRLYIAASNLLSRGSARTLVEHAGKWINTRRDGLLTPMPFRVLHQWADFGSGPRLAVAVNWGDLVTAHHSTKIPNIEVFFEATAFRWGAVLFNQWAAEIMRNPELQRHLTNLTDVILRGPDAHARDATSCAIVAEVTRGTERVRSRLHTPEAYTFTADVVARVIERYFRPPECPASAPPPHC